MGEDGLEATVYRAIVDSAVNPFFLMDHTGTVTWASPAITELLGHPPDDLVGTNILEWLDEAGQLLALDALGEIEALATRNLADRWMGSGTVFNVRTASGSYVPCEATMATPARSGLDVFVIQLRRAAVQAAIGDALQAMTELRSLGRVLELLCRVVEQSVADVCVEVGHSWNGHAFTCFHSPILRIAAGASGEDLPWMQVDGASDVIEAHLDDLPERARLHAATAGFTGCWVQPVVSGVGDEVVANIVVWHGPDVPMSTLTRHTLGRAAFLVALALQWDEGRNALAHAADHDLLTGLPNRRALMGRLEETVGAQGMVLYVDLDGFKAVNDDHGHRAGDAVLAVVAERLRAGIRPGDFLARLGGDEFVVVCPGSSTGRSVTLLAERLIDILSQPIKLDELDLTVQIGASIGIAATDSGREPEVVLHNADALLREAKRTGKGRALIATAEPA